MRDNLHYGLVPSRLCRNPRSPPTARSTASCAAPSEQRDVSFVTMPPVPPTAPVSAADIGSWYKAHASTYRRPETVRLQYVEVDGARCRLR